MTVHWTETAEDHLDSIYSYISLGSPEYAKRVIDRIKRRSKQIADFHQAEFGNKSELLYSADAAASARSIWSAFWTVPCVCTSEHQCCA